MLSAARARSGRAMGRLLLRRPLGLPATSTLARRYATFALGPLRQTLVKLMVLLRVERWARRSLLGDGPPPFASAASVALFPELERSRYGCTLGPLHQAKTDDVTAPIFDRASRPDLRH
jgi:hypothetical protein